MVDQTPLVNLATALRQAPEEVGRVVRSAMTVQVQMRSTTLTQSHLILGWLAFNHIVPQRLRDAGMKNDPLGARIKQGEFTNSRFRVDPTVIAIIDRMAVEVDELATRARQQEQIFNVLLGVEE